MSVMPTRSVEKVWGRDTLPAPFTAPAGQRIGEIWFEPDAAMDDLLVKYLFTSEKLSVQVHPRNGEAGPGQPGKDECWLVLDAEPDARLAIGFDEALDAEAMRAAALDGSIEDRLTWLAVQPGDFFYLPSGTVHAIGAGLSLVEVQQNSDITYRLYDYGRPRELHLDEALRVADRTSYPDRYRRHVAADEAVSLVEGPFFRLDQCIGAPSSEVAARYDGPVQVLPLAGDVVIDGQTVSPGQSAIADALSDVRFSAAGRTLISQTL